MVRAVRRWRGVHGLTRTPSLADQAQMIRALCERTWGRDYRPAAETWLRLDAEDVAALEFLADRLDRMAPHEAEILRITARRR